MLNKYHSNKWAAARCVLHKTRCKDNNKKNKFQIKTLKK